MQGFHIPAAPPLYTNTFLLISDAGHAVVIDPAADAQTYDKILKENIAHLHHPPARQNRPRGSESDDRPGQGIRLRLGG